MLLIPAIDLKDGRCVRLKQGNMSDATIFDNDLEKTAKKWFDITQRLHVVDLNGAFAGKPQNLEAIKQIISVKKTYPNNKKIEIGGGIRDIATIEQYVNLGVDFVILGTIALQDPNFVKIACKEFTGKIIVGIDAKNGFVAVNGWADVSSIKAIDLANKFEDFGVSSIIYTDIAKDGMMQGLNLTETITLAQNTSIPIIASGGITNLDSIRELASASKQANIIGAICGRAIYEGTLDLNEAIRLVQHVN